MKVFQKEFIVKEYEVDAWNRLKMPMLFNYMQEAAGLHAESLGVGYSSLSPLGLAWVISRTRIRLGTLPNSGNELILTTWPSEMNKYIAGRDFLCETPGGEIVMKASTVWMLIELDTLRPRRMSVLPVELSANERGYILGGLPERIKESPVLEASCIERTSAYSDIDLNRHVNNAIYAGWIMDCFPWSVHESNAVKELQIDFEYGIGPEEDLTINIGSSKNEGEYLLEASSARLGKTIFRSLIAWEKSLSPKG